MSVQRGDVVLAWYPFASGQGGKRRPCLVIQNDADNQKLANTIIAQITTNLKRIGDKSHLLIEAATAGRSAGRAASRFPYILQQSRDDRTELDRQGNRFTPRRHDAKGQHLPAGCP